MASAVLWADVTRLEAVMQTSILEALDKKKVSDQILGISKITNYFYKKKNGLIFCTISQTPKNVYNIIITLFV